MAAGRKAREIRGRLSRRPRSAPGPICALARSVPAAARRSGTDDIAFITKLVEKYRRQWRGRPEAGLYHRHLQWRRDDDDAGLRPSDLFAAAASVIMNFTETSAKACHPSRPVPMLLMNGTAEPLIPYNGGRGTSRFAAEGLWSTEKTLAFWRRANGCDLKGASTTDLGDRNREDQSTVTRSIALPTSAGRRALSRSMAAAIGCPGEFPTRTSRASRRRSSGRRTATSTAPTRFLGFSNNSRTDPLKRSVIGPPFPAAMPAARRRTRRAARYP